MDENETIDRVNEVFADSFEIAPDKLLPQARIFDDLGLDSLDTVDLIVALQKKFGIQIREDERVRTIRTLADVYRFILILKQEEQQKRASAP